MTTKGRFHLPCPPATVGIHYPADFLCRGCNAGQELLLLSQRTGQGTVTELLLGGTLLLPQWAQKLWEHRLCCSVICQAALTVHSTYQFPNEPGALHLNAMKLNINLFHMQFKMDVCMNIFLIERVISCIRYLNGPINLKNLRRLSKINDSF